MRTWNFEAPQVLCRSHAGCASLLRAAYCVLVFDGRDVAEGAVQSAFVLPLDPADGREHNAAIVLLGTAFGAVVRVLSAL